MAFTLNLFLPTCYRAILPIKTFTTIFNFNLPASKSTNPMAIVTCQKSDVMLELFGPEIKDWARLQSKLNHKSLLIKKRIVINMYKLPYVGRPGRLDDTYTITLYSLKGK